MSGNSERIQRQTTRAREQREGGLGLVDVTLSRLRPHPMNPNDMDRTRLAKLKQNIANQAEYPPLVVRPHPQEEGAFQVIDGHQRLRALQELGYATAHCYVWQCDDRQALLLLGTINRLHGEDEPVKRAELFQELSHLMSVEEMARLLPKDARGIEKTLAMLDLDVDQLMAGLSAQIYSGDKAPRLYSVMVLPQDLEMIEQAVHSIASGLAGEHKKGRALAQLAIDYLQRKEMGDGGED